MKNYLFPVYLVTGFLLVYVTSVQVNLSTALLFLMFGISPIVVIWMVYRVLKADVAVPHTFEERWYGDFDVPKLEN